MDNDEQRDYKEELANAMIPFEENLEQVINKDYTLDALLLYARHFPDRILVEEKNGYIYLELGLKVAPDGSLWRDPEEDH